MNELQVVRSIVHNRNRSSRPCRYIVLDSENTTWNTGNPFDIRNWNVCWAWKSGILAGRGTDVASTAIQCSFSDPNDGGTEALRESIAGAEVIVGFNLKYDLHWLRRCNIPFEGKRLWCVQVAEFLLGRQQTPYPSLEGTATKYNLGHKGGGPAEYWANGVNTHEIPKPILAEYACQDVNLTEQAYLLQLELIPAPTFYSLYMQDLQTLQEMEWNGLHYDKELSLRRAQELATEKLQLQDKLKLYHNVPGFNWASSHHLSALLYGGEIIQIEKEPDGHFKSGLKAGQPKFRNTQKVYRLPRIYKPIRGSETQTQGVWSVEETYLRSLTGSKELIDSTLKIKEIDKKVNTYYRGLPELHERMNWEPKIIHTQLNQCVARTGRLSSSKPNLQNLEDSVQEIFTTRYD